MGDLRDQVLRAIIDGDYSDNELQAIADHSLNDDISEGLARRIYFKMKLREAMEMIATVPIEGGEINDTGYSQTMEEIENMRNTWKNNHQQSKENNMPATAYDNIIDPPYTHKNTSNKQPKKRNLSPETRKILASNAAIARAAKARKRS